MCFSKEVSLITFIVGFISSVLCFLSDSPTYKILGLFFINVVMVQLTEYLLWGHPQCDDYNKKLSMIQMIIINLQPIVLFMAVLYYNTLNDKTHIILYTTVIVYLLVIVNYFLNAVKEIGCDVREEEHKPLDWKWTNYQNTGFIYLFFAVVISIIGYYGLPSLNTPFAVIAVVSYLTSGLIYGNKYSGTMWCFIGALLPNLLLISKLN